MALAVATLGCHVFFGLGQLPSHVLRQSPNPVLPVIRHVVMIVGHILSAMGFSGFALGTLAYMLVRANENIRIPRNRRLL